MVQFNQSQEYCGSHAAAGDQKDRITAGWELKAIAMRKETCECPYVSANEAICSLSKLKEKNDHNGSVGDLN